MGSSFNSAVFADDVAEHVRGWADGARRRNRVAAVAITSDTGCQLVAEPSEEATSCTILCVEAT
jgi:mlo protein